MTTDFDRASRYLTRQAGLELLTWLVDLPAEKLAFVRWLETRLSVPNLPERTGDMIAHVQRLDENGMPWAIQIEFQSEPDPEMTGRLLVYAGLIWLYKPYALQGDRFHLLQVVVNLTGVGRTACKMVWRDGAGTVLEPIEWNMQNLEAGDILTQIASGSLSRMLLPWIPLMQRGDEVDIINQWLVLANQEPDQRRKSDFGLALTFAELADRRDIWTKALEGFDMRQSAVVNAWKAEAKAEGIAMGKAEGKMEGIAEGKAEGKMEGIAGSVRKVLEARFGKLPQDLVSALEAARDVNYLDRWIELSCKAASLDQFRREAAV